MNRYRWTGFGLRLAAALAVAGTLGLASHAHAQSALRGEIKIDGSSTVYPVTEAVATAFSEQYPNVRVTVGVSGTGGGFKRFVQGETDISDASRHIKWAEFMKCAQNGTHFIEIPVAWDGLSVVVNPSNDWVDKLTVEQLRRIYSADSPARSWSDLNPQWPNRPIKVYSPGTDSGTFDYFKEAIVGDEGALRSDMSISEDDNVLVRGVAGDRNAIGYFGAAYYFNNRNKLRAVPIVNPETSEAMMPSPRNVQQGTYAPLSRPLYIYVKQESLRRPEMQKFVEFYLDHAAQMAQRVDYVALDDEMYDRARSHYRERLSGTHFWHKDGTKREGPLPKVYMPGNRLIFR